MIAVQDTLVTAYHRAAVMVPLWRSRRAFLSPRWERRYRGGA
jgi:hypothetical protein